MYALGQFIPSDSLIHGLDPRTKALSVILLSLVILNSQPAAAAIFTLFLLSLIPVSRIPAGAFLRALKPALPFLLLLFGIHLLFTGGAPIPPFPDWRITVTYQGLRLLKGTLVTWRFALLLMSASFLTFTTSPSELVCGLEWLLRPLNILGISSRDVAFMVSLALRFVPTLLEEIRMIREAQMARGASFGTGGLRKRTRSILFLLTPLLNNSIQRAEDLALAMESRGYGRGARTSMRELKLG
ncbi:MAG: energy-coupling factor transporter transmembrane protein EcfT, partial [Deltaproteobacteria bacterium]|nr:energy-coupling factor transporter transmembrane protein EcfT [Deltaproteobacteria bacterium]